MQELDARPTKGRVCLVGAGPGDPELLTLKAVNRLRAADVILHDALISPEILALAPPSTRLFNVGKRCGKKRITQQEINALMISLAVGGNLVVRLKSGDPMIFGRGGEELDALRQAGVEVEVVPGITAAVAAAATVEMALTDRRCAGQVVLVSAHHAPGKPGPDWRGLVTSRATIVVYMPGEHRNVAAGLIGAGMDSRTPCVILSKISLPQQQSYRTTLEGLLRTPRLASPSVLIVGETVAVSSLAECHSLYCRVAESGAQTEIRRQQLKSPGTLASGYEPLGTLG
jgi:uroporphyrin-III C-methyltransferase